VPSPSGGSKFRFDTRRNYVSGLNAFHGETKATTLHTRQIEQIKDQVDLAIALDRDRFKILALFLFIDFTAKQESRQGLDRGQGCSQLVRNAAHEFRFQMIQLVQTLRFFLQSDRPN